jgi:hypothetical protein
MWNLNRIKIKVKISAFFSLWAQIEFGVVACLNLFYVAVRYFFYVDGFAETAVFCSFICAMFILIDL